MRRRPVLGWIAALIGASVLTTVAGLIWFVIFAGAVYGLYLLATGAHTLGYANTMLLLFIAFGTLWCVGLFLAYASRRRAKRVNKHT